MKNKNILILGLFFLTLIMTSGKSEENNIENCISELMKSFEYSEQNDFFLKKNIDEIIFLKKIKKKGYNLNNIIDVYHNEYKTSKTSNYSDFEIQLWLFENDKKAEEACDLVKKIITESSYFEKPPKAISYYDNYCIFITTPVFSKVRHIRKAIDIINNNISNCM